MKEKIIEALKRLDPEIDNDWTRDGLPPIKTIESLTGVGKLTRAEITHAAPQFTRKNPVFVSDETVSDETVSDETVSDETVSEEDKIELAVSDAEREIIEVQKILDVANRKLSDALQKRDALIVERDGNRPAHQNQINIMDYINSQVELGKKK